MWPRPVTAHVAITKMLPTAVTEIENETAGSSNVNRCSSVTREFMYHMHMSSVLARCHLQHSAAAGKRCRYCKLAFPRASL
jgi:hypothetical protein